MIEGLRALLEGIQGWDEIATIIPGRIKPTRSTGPLRLTVQMPTPSGLKCLAKRPGAVQEVFFVTSRAPELEAKIRTLSER